MFLRVFFVFCLAISFVSVSSAQEDEDALEEDAAVIFNQAQDAHEKGDLKTALKLYDEALKLAPEFPEAEFQRGNVFLSQGKIAEAEKAFRRAIELREDWTLPMTSLGTLLVQKGNYAEAEKILTKAIELDAQNSPALISLTELKLQTNSSPQILRVLLTKISFLSTKAKPTASLLAARGAVEFALGDKSAAKKSLSAALGIDSNNLLALQRRAEISITEGDFAGALNDAKRFSAVSPNSNGSRLLLARIYAASGDTSEALKILDTLDNSNKDVSALRDLIAANESENVADLEKRLEADEKNAAILGRLCALLRTENPVKAANYCRRASEAEPENVNHAVGFGAALVQAKQFDNAVSVLRNILQIAPDNQTARANLATALFQSKKYAEAKPEYRRLTEKNPNNAIAFYFLAISHDSLGEYIDAMANYQQFLRLADSAADKLEIEKVNLRLPVLQKQINRKGKGK